MWKEENLQGEYISLNQIIEALELEKCNQFVRALLDYSDIEDCMINRDFNCIKNNKKTWMEISYAISGLLEIDYTPQGNLQRYADEIYDLAKFRIENNVNPESDFTIPELIKEVEEKISVFKKLLLKLKLMDPKTLKETAETFIEKGETEYQKIMNTTADSFINASDRMLKENLIEQAILNNPVTDHTIFDLPKSYSLYTVAKLAGETVDTIFNYCVLQKYFDENGEPTVYGTEITKYVTKTHNLTEEGKNAIVAVFSQIRNSEKGMRSTSIGKAE